ncbi:MAG: hypothetical protein SFZ24_06925 [Planctomycetota bacterium]|nr:hypothetical protein [Planctomycetota bacterium]
MRRSKGVRAAGAVRARVPMMRLAALAVFGWALASIAACSPGPGGNAAERAAGLSGAPDPAMPVPVVGGVDEGVELRWWVAQDGGGAVGAVIASLGEPAPARDRTVLDRWEASGLRLWRMPVAKLQQLEASMTRTGPRYREWLGWKTVWAEAFRGRRVGGRGPVMVSGERVQVPRGVARMIVRCWPVPGEGGTARVRTELAFQIEKPQAPTPADPFTLPRFIPIEEQGHVLREITFRETLEPGWIYVITSEAPGMTWSSADAAALAPAEEGVGFAPPDAVDAEVWDGGPDAATEPGEAYGPRGAPPISFGEAMLSAPAVADESGAEAVAPRKAVIVIIPATSRDVTLLP